MRNFRPRVSVSGVQPDSLVLVRIGTSLQFDTVVLALPLILVYPQESEPNRRFLFGQREVDKFDIDTCGGRACVGRIQPFIGGPMQQEHRTRLYPQAGGASGDTAPST